MSSAINRPPNPKFTHVYIVMRYDSYIDAPMQAITTLKVFLNESEANAEAGRLNQLIRTRLGDQNEIEYYVSQARVKTGLLKNDGVDQKCFLPSARTSSGDK